MEYIHERAKALQMWANSAFPALCCSVKRVFRFGRHADAVLDFTTVLNARPRFANALFRRAFSYK